MGRGVASDKARERSHTEEVRGKGPGAVTGGVRKDDRQNNFRNTFGKLFVWQPGGVRVCVGVVCRVVSKTTGKSWCMGGVDGGKWGGVVSGWGVGSEVCMAGVGFYGGSGWSSDGSIRWS